MLLLCVLIVGSGSAWATDFEPSDFSGQGTTSTGSPISVEKDGITFACDKGFGTTQIRCYSGGTITISSSNTITDISFTFSGGSYTGGLETSYSNLSTTSWTKKLSSQARITKCTVTTSSGGGGDTPTQYTVTYDANGGTGTMTDSNSPYNSGATVTVLGNQFTYEGYDFVNWNTAADGSGTDYDEDDTFTITANTTLYAQWTANGGGSTIEHTYNFAGANNFYTNTNLTTHPGSTSSNNVETIYYSDGSVFVASGTSRYFSAATSGYFMLGKTGAQLSLPTFDGYKITQVKLHTSGNCSSNVQVSIVSGDYTASDAQKWSTNSDFTYNIGSNYQTSPLSVNVTNAYNAQFTSITLVCVPCPSIDASNPAELAYNATSGSISYSISNEPDPAGTLSVTVPNGSWVTPGEVTSTTVPFTCTANPNSTARTVTVVLNYRYGNNEAVHKNITITQAGAPLTPTSLTLTGTYPTTFIEGDDFSHDGMTVTATFSNSSTEDVTSSATFTGYNMSQTGEQTVTVTYTHNNVSVTQTYTITVNEIPTKTIAQFIAAGGGKCYLTGTVSNIVNTTYGNFDLTDESGTIYVYGCLTSAGVSAQFSTLNIEEGDVIKVLANEYEYYNNTTHEAKNVVFVEEIVPNAQILTVSATNGTVEITGKTLENGSCEVTEGASVTATATPAEHYTFTSWTAEGVTLADATANPLTFTMPTNGVTLTANFTENAKHDATFYVQGVEVGTDDDVYEGEAITFPSVTAPTGYTFMGWTTSEITGSQDAAPEPLVSSDNMGSADVSYYAVFAIGTVSGEGSIELTNKAIQDYKSNNTISYSNDYSIYDWTGRYLVNVATSTYYLQLGYNTDSSKSAYNSHLTTPECASNIKSITIDTNNNTASGRTFYLCSAGNLGTASSENATYGSGSTSAANGSVTITVSGNTKQFHIYPDGTAYIKSVSLTYSTLSYTNYCTTIPPVSVTVTSAGYATFACDFSLDFTGVDGITANTASVNGSTVTLTPVTKVPAGAGIVLSGSEGTYYVPVTTETVNALSNNELVGVTEETTVEATADGKTNYILSNETSGVGFYKASGAKLRANHAYLSTTGNSGSGSVKEFLGFAETDGIATVSTATENEGTWYNLAGQRIARPTRGLYIVNGRKVLVK